MKVEGCASPLNLKTRHKVKVFILGQNVALRLAVLKILEADLFYEATEFQDGSNILVWNKETIVDSMWFFNCIPFINFIT